MNIATKKWLFLKFSSVALIPLMPWFIFKLVSIFDKDYFDVLSFFSLQPSKFFVSLLLIFAFFFSNLSISEVFEDYIQDEKTKSVANNILRMFAIIVPLITIITLLSLKI